MIKCLKRQSRTSLLASAAMRSRWFGIIYCQNQIQKDFLHQERWIIKNVAQV